MQKKSKKKLVRKVGYRIKLAVQIVVFFVLLIMAAGIIYFYVAYGNTILHMQSEAKEMVGKSTPETFRSSQTGLVYDTDGNLISTLKSDKDVYYIEYEDIPQAAIDAMVVTEDRNFLEHSGVDYLANVRAAIALIKNKGKITQGASTITQQLARGVFLTQQVTYQRKIEEIFVAQELEKKYTKNQIMEFYLNEIYFNNGHYGLQSAAKGYFGKSVTDLSLSQLTFLCAIPNNPNLYNPITHYDNTIKRRDRMLDQMYAAKKISFEEYQKALNEKITLIQEKSKKNNYITTYVNYCATRALMKQNGFVFQNQFESEEEKKAYEDSYEELYNRYQKELYSKGYRIYTSIDMKKQKLLQNSVDHALEQYTEKNKEGVYQMQGAAVCIDNDNGKVVAIVGGRNQNLAGYTLNRAYQSFRQPGSSIKPLIVYTPAFERGYTPASPVVDERFEGGPKNSDNTYLGKTNLQKAIEYSKNTVAWKLFEELTPKVGLSYLLNMNFVKISEKDYVPAVALGGMTVGASPLEMTAAYATLENDGIYREPTCIVKIMDAEGNEVLGDKTTSKDIYQAKAAKIMTETLTGVIKNGTGRGLGLNNTVSAGKTGTTNDKKDGWFMGYTPYYTTGVWVGYDMPRTVDNLTGSTYPGTIWHDFMNQIHDSTMNASFRLFDWRAGLKPKEEKTDETKDKEDAQVEDTGTDADQTDTDQGAADQNNAKDNQNNTDKEDPDEIGRDHDDNLDQDIPDQDSTDTDTTDNGSAADNGSTDGDTGTPAENNSGNADNGNAGENNTSSQNKGNTSQDTPAADDTAGNQ